MKYTAGLSVIRTLNISDGLLEDFLEGLWVLKLLLDLGNDGLSKLLLLTLLDLSLVTDPGVKNGLSLSGQSGALGDLEGLGLELCGLLDMVSEMRLATICAPKTHLGNLKEGLGDVNNTTHLLDVLNALLDGLSVVGTGRVQNATDLLNLGVGPLSVHWSRILSNSEEDGEKGESDNGLLVDDVVLVGEGVDSGSGGGGEDGGLGDEGVAREGIEDGLGLLLWLLSWDGRLVSGQSRDSADWSSWTDTGRAYTTVSPLDSIDLSLGVRAPLYVPRAVFAKRDAIVI